MKKWIKRGKVNIFLPFTILPLLWRIFIHFCPNCSRADCGRSERSFTEPSVASKSQDLKLHFHTTFSFFYPFFGFHGDLLAKKISPRSVWYPGTKSRRSGVAKTAKCAISATVFKIDAQTSWTKKIWCFLFNSPFKSKFLCYKMIIDLIEWLLQEESVENGGLERTRA